MGFIKPPHTIIIKKKQTLAIRCFLYSIFALAICFSVSCMVWLQPAAKQQQHIVDESHNAVVRPRLAAGVIQPNRLLLQSISFIIPTKGRDTLRRTIDSLLNQTLSGKIDFEILIGVDAQHVNDTSNELLFPSYPNEKRIRYIMISTTDQDRGSSSNGAGQLRNMIIQQHATMQYVAFCDDDDTLSPHYLEWLEEALQLISSARCNVEAVNLILFRMNWPTKGGLPPIPVDQIKSNQTEALELLENKGRNIRLRHSRVGISFAVLRTTFVEEGGYAFETSAWEDYQYLYRISKDRSLNMVVSACTAYFVRTVPLMTDDDAYCHYNLFTNVGVMEPPKDMKFLVEKNTK